MKLIRREFIYEENTPSCHASTLVRSGDTVIAAWFGGTHEGHDDVQIWVSIRENGVWGKPACVSAAEDVPHWNPVLFDNGDELLLFYKRGKTIPHWQTMLTRSSDGGKSWTAPTLLCGDDNGGRGPVKNKPIRLRDGRILAGASHEFDGWRAFTDLSSDNGYTWERSGYIPVPAEDIRLIQPALWEDDRGCHLLMRSGNHRTEGRRVYRSDAADGVHWCEAYPLELPHNNSGLDLVSAGDRLILCCNPVPEGRTPLCLLESEDGIRFTRSLVLEDAPGEYSYPAVIFDGEKICGTYTWKREKIVYFEAEL